MDTICCLRTMAESTGNMSRHCQPDTEQRVSRQASLGISNAHNVPSAEVLNTERARAREPRTDSAIKSQELANVLRRAPAHLDGHGWSNRSGSGLPVKVLGSGVRESDLWPKLMTAAQSVRLSRSAFKGPNEGDGAEQTQAQHWGPT
jgi:hypothetical protein